MKISSDFHLHTNLSYCASPEATLAAYLPQFEKCGLTTVGFSNHFWDEKVDGANDWYRGQNLEHLLELKAELPADSSTKIAFGCESEYRGNGVFGILPETAQENFDFVLLPTGHFHMKDFVIPAAITKPAEARNYFIERFCECAEYELGVPTGLAHAFVPMGFDETDKAPILRAISNADFRECFALAEKHKKSIELHKAYVATPNEDLRAEYRRLMRIAVDCGCIFHAGSDAHKTENFGAYYAALGDFADEVGITSLTTFGF